MVDLKQLGRRRFLSGAAAGVSTLMLGGCDNLSESPEFTKVLSGAEAVSRFAQKVVAGRTALAREYTDADLSAEFCANGTTLPNDPDYQRLAQNEFADWRLDVGGLDQRPGSF